MNETNKPDTQKNRFLTVAEVEFSMKGGERLMQRFQFFFHKESEQGLTATDLSRMQEEGGQRLIQMLEPEQRDGLVVHNVFLVNIIYLGETADAEFWPSKSETEAAPAPAKKKSARLRSVKD